MNIKWIIIISITILVIIVAFNLYQYSISSQNEMVTETQEKLVRLGATSRAFYYRMGYWPESLADLTNRHGNISFLPGPHEPMLIDAWGNPIIYKPFDPEYDSGLVVSYGKDGQRGGKKINSDIEVQFGVDKLEVMK